MTSVNKQIFTANIVVILIVSLLSTSIQAGTAKSDFQTWIPVNTNIKLGEHLRLFFEHQWRIGNDSSHLNSAMVRPAVGWQLTPQASIWLGYLMSADSKNLYSNHYLIENRAWQGFSWKDTTDDKQFIWEMRNRLEERFLPQNSDPSIRWRTRFRGEYIIDESPVSLIASEEIFLNLNDNAHNRNLQAGAQQNRAYLGFGYRFAPEFQIESGYLYQHVWKRQPADDANNSIWMTNFNLNF